MKNIFKSFSKTSPLLEALAEAEQFLPREELTEDWIEIYEDEMASDKLTDLVEVGFDFYEYDSPDYWKALLKIADLIEGNDSTEIIKYKIQTNKEEHEALVNEISDIISNQFTEIDWKTNNDVLNTWASKLTFSKIRRSERQNVKSMLISQFRLDLDRAPDYERIEKLMDLSDNWWDNEKRKASNV